MALDGSRVATGPSNVKITQLKKYMFNSALKRMSVLAVVNEQGSTQMKVLSKGAPEILQNYMKEVPADYEKLYL